MTAIHPQNCPTIHSLDLPLLIDAKYLSWHPRPTNIIACLWTTKLRLVPLRCFNYFHMKKQHSHIWKDYAGIKLESSARSAGHQGRSLISSETTSINAEIAGSISQFELTASLSVHIFHCISGCTRCIWCSLLGKASQVCN
jgi:hypothetical protein